MKKRKSTSVVRHAKKLKSVKLATKKHLLRKRRPIHKRVLLHPASVFMLLCVGVLLAGWTFLAGADNLTVTASVLAPLPSKSAQITYPFNQAHSTRSTITVIGDCASNTYVQLYRNGSFSGIANCGPSVTSFQILTDLSLGANQFYTRVFNITNNEGPQSTPITVWRDQSRQSPVTVQQPVKPLTINHSYQYKTYTSGKSAVWNLNISGGVLPYALTVSWGDGQTSTVVRSNSDAFDISHTYTLSGTRVWTDYTIKLTAIDSKDTVANLQLSATVTIDGSRPNNPGTTTGNGNANDAISKFIKQWVWLIWPTYGVILLMTTSFWLGEREEYVKLIRVVQHGRKRQHAR